MCRWWPRPADRAFSPMCPLPDHDHTHHINTMTGPRRPASSSSTRWTPSGAAARVRGRWAWGVGRGTVVDALGPLLACPPTSHAMPPTNQPHEKLTDPMYGRRGRDGVGQRGAADHAPDRHGARRLRPAREHQGTVQSSQDAVSFLGGGGLLLLLVVYVYVFSSNTHVGTHTQTNHTNTHRC